MMGGSYDWQNGNARGAPRLSFGKYAGWTLDDVPAGYLGWLFEEGRIDETLRCAIAAELARRLAEYAPDLAPRRVLPAPDVLHMVHGIVSAGFRALVRQHHPDAGGAQAEMVAATAARDWLTSVVAGRV